MLSSETKPFPIEITGDIDLEPEILLKKNLQVPSGTWRF